MKKLSLTVLALVFLLSTGSLFGLEIGGSLGYNLLLEDVDGGGFPAFEARLAFLELDSFKIGALVGYLPIFDYDAGMLGDFSASSLNIMAFGKIGFGSIPLYAMFGAGFHIWTGDISGSDFGVMGGLGFETPLAENLSLDIGARFHLVLGDGDPLKMLTLLAGVNYKL